MQATSDTEDYPKEMPSKVVNKLFAEVTTKNLEKWKLGGQASNYPGWSHMKMKVSCRS